jgi:hypothetical protein
MGLTLIWSVMLFFWLAWLPERRARLGENRARADRRFLSFVTVLWVAISGLIVFAMATGNIE